MSTDIQLKESSALMSVIERVASDPNSDISKLEKMLDMQERVLDRNAAQAFTADMAAMQGEMPRVLKLAIGHNTTYAKLEDVNDAVRPILQKYGFAVTFSIEQPDVKFVKITAILSHKQGHKQESSLILPLDSSGSKNSVQSIGSTVTYGRRYTACALLNISTGDDTNGAKISDEIVKKKQKLSITNERLSAGIERIKSGEYSLDLLYENFELTPDQEKMLNEKMAVTND